MEELGRRSAQVFHFRPRRRRPREDARLVLSPLDRIHVFSADAGGSVVHTSGKVRETCPHCDGRHLLLVLRQDCVRLAHLFCDQCNTCFDAHYPNGKCALTI